MPIMPIQKAGAIVLSQRNPALVALLYRSRQGDWSFPKGHIEKGESAPETMRREVMEETGLSVRLVGKLPPMEYNHPRGDHIVVRMFLMQSQDDTALKTEFNGDKIVWVPYEEVADKLTHDNAKQYYHETFRQVKKEIEMIQSITR